jgi:hypothetical protein
MNIIEALKTLSAVELPKGVEVELAPDVRVTVRPLPAAVSRAVDLALEHLGDPEPEPPLKRDDHAGSLAAPRPDLTDPAYARAFGRWYRRRSTVLALVASGPPTFTGQDDPAAVAVEVQTLERRALEMLSERQLQSLREALTKAESDLESAAAKN